MTNSETANEQTEEQSEQVEKTETQKQIDQKEEELKNMSREYESRSRENYGVGVFNVEGGQELIDQYGTEKVMDTMTQSQDAGETALYQVICRLEPDKQNRAKLYETILKSVKTKQEAYEQSYRDGTVTEENPQRYVVDQWGFTPNNVRNLEWQVQEYAKADGFLANNPDGALKVMGLMQKFSRGLRNFGTKPMTNYIDATMSAFGYGDLNAMKAKITENGGNLLAVVEQGQIQNEQLKQEMFNKKQVLLQELNSAMAANTQANGEKYLEAANGVIRDLDQTLGLQEGLESQAGQQASEKFIKELSDKLRALEEQAAKELEEKNRSLNETMKSIS